MLDYVNWYLVELDRHLRGKRPAQACTEFLLETRAHLEDSIEDLAGKGIDRTVAAKAALVDFGDPETVAKGFLGRAMSRPAFYRWFAVACILGLTLPFTLTIMLLEPNKLRETAYFNGGFWLPWLGLAIALWLSLRTRTWSIATAALVACAGALIGSLVIASNIELYQVAGSTRYATPWTQREQVRARTEWLERFDRDFGMLQAWRADRKVDGPLKKLAEREGGFVAPVPSSYGYRSSLNGALPSDSRLAPTTIIMYTDYWRPGYRMERWSEWKDAKQVWLQHADAYAKYVKSLRTTLNSELNGLSQVVPSSSFERWKLLGLPLVGATGVASLFAVLLNGLALLLADGVSHRRRAVWRRQIG